MASVDWDLAGKIRVTQTEGAGTAWKTPLRRDGTGVVVRLMKRVLLLCFALAGTLCAEEKATFSHGLTEAEFKAAGLDKLNAEERGRLDELVARREAESLLAAKPAPAPAKPVRPVIITGKIAGTMAGWSEGTVLVLEDGQRWQVVDEGKYRAAPVRRKPKVELFPLSNGNYIMSIDTVPRRAQVKRVTE